MISPRTRPLARGRGPSYDPAFVSARPSTPEPGAQPAHDPILRVSACYDLGMARLSRIKAHDRGDYATFYRGSIATYAAVYGPTRVYADDGDLRHLGGAVEGRGRAFSALPFHRYRNRMVDIIQRHEERFRRTPMLKAGVDADAAADYLVLVLSKLPLLLEALEERDAEAGLWVDAGLMNPGYAEIRGDLQPAWHAKKLRPVAPGRAGRFAFSGLSTVPLRRRDEASILLLEPGGQVLAGSFVIATDPELRRSLGHAYRETFERCLDRELVTTEQGLLTLLVRNGWHRRLELVPCLEYRRLYAKVAKPSLVERRWFASLGPVLGACPPMWVRRMEWEALRCPGPWC